MKRSMQQTHDRNLKRLGAAGVPIDEQYIEEHPWLRVEQTGGPLDSVILAPPIGGYTIAIWLRILACRSRIRICECEISSPRLDDSSWYLIQSYDRQPFYRDIAKLQYPREDVLNHQITSKHALELGDVLEGVLLAQSLRPLPSWCQTGIRLELDVQFFDQFDNAYSVKSDVRVINDGTAAHRSRHVSSIPSVSVNQQEHSISNEAVSRNKFRHRAETKRS